MRYSEVELYPNEWLNTITHEDIENNTFPVIVDRDQSDVHKVATLNKKKWDNFTDDEKAFWYGVVKGAYNAEDLNRVGWAVELIAGMMKNMGFGFSVSPKSDWEEEDIPTAEQLSVYLKNVRVLRGLIAVKSDTPQVPTDMDKLTWGEANDIEKILEDIELLLRKSLAAFRHCGAAVCGGNGLLIR